MLVKTKQLLPVLLVDSADYHPSKGIISLGRCPREIIHSRGDDLHYPPTSQAITVYCLYYQTVNISGEVACTLVSNPHLPSAKLFSKPDFFILSLRNSNLYLSSSNTPHKDPPQCWYLKFQKLGYSIIFFCTLQSFH